MSNDSLEAKIAALSPEQRELLRRKMGQAAPAGDVADRIVPVTDRSAVPLSFQQQQVWILDQLNPGKAVYNIPAAFRLEGPLDAPLLERALLALVERHEALRTTFAAVKGVATQQVQPRASLSLPTVDLTELPQSEREAEASRLASQEAAQPFNLENGPLLRATLLKLGAQHHVLLLTVHHIVSDQQTTRLLMQELSALYGALVEGRPSPLPPLPLQYLDFAAWQRQRLSGAALDKQLAYWKTQLSGTSPLELPTDRPRPQRQSQLGAQRKSRLSRELTDAVKALSRSEGVTPYMTLLAVFNVLLHRYSGQTDLCVGTPVAGRSRVELESVVGFFVGTLVLRTDLSAQPTVRQLLRSVRETVLGGFAHQEVPFEQLVEALKPERTLSRNPLFQVMFTYEDVAAQSLTLSKLEVTPFAWEVSTEKFDLTLFMAEEDAAFTAAFAYSTDLFDAATIDRMSAHFVRLLEEAVAHPDLRVDRLSLLTPAERKRLLVDFNEGRAYPKDRCIHQLFEEQVAKSPDAPAVSFAGAQLSYRELDRRANLLAQHLATAGVGRGSLVALYVERSIETIVGILGVLKAGGAFVPLDPVYPADRVAFVLEDSKASVLLTQAKLAATLSVEGVKVVLLDTDWPQIERGVEPAPPRTPATSEDTAYIIYTSGSTGRPKGTLIPHQNVVRLLTATEDWFHFGADDVWTFFHSHAFDFSVWEMWGALCYGGRVVVVPYMVSRSPAEFLQLLRTEKVTVLNQTPSAFRTLIAADEESGEPRPLSLRFVIFGGEALDLSTLRPWVRRRGAEQPTLVNMYGITETTVHVTYRPLTAADIASSKGSIIGKPIPDLQLYLLDPNLEPTPVGVAGELYVGGAGLARGYLNRPELTAERFIASPFSAQPGARLYRSGDLARRMPDGDVEYLGRIDFQVKIRGFRIELGEIEARLLAQPSVRETVVLAREDVPGDKQLVAYVVAKEGATLSVEALRAALQKALPAYMVPAAFVPLAALPLTENGKVDRKALPKPDFGANRKAYVAPRTPIEQQLADVWARVLRLEKVGVLDNFFEIGGDSLKVIRLVAQLRELGLEVVPPMVFANPTIAGLAPLLDKNAHVEPGTEWRHELQIVKGGVAPLEGEAPVAYQEERFFRIWSSTRRDGGLGKPCGPEGFIFEGPLDVGLLEDAVNAFLYRHRVLWSRHREVDGVVHKVLEPVRRLALRRVDLGVLPESERVSACMSDVHANEHSCTDLKSPAPRLAATLYRFSDTRHMLCAVSSLGLFDGGSFGIFWKEVFDFYGRSVSGERVEVALPPVQYADYAQFQRDWHKTPKAQQAAAYWKDRLKGVQAISQQLPTDFPRAPIDARRKQSFWVPFPQVTVFEDVPPETTKALRALVAAEKTSLAAVAYAAYSAALGRRANVTEVTMRTTNDSRRRVGGLEGVVGFMQNFAYWRLDLSGNPSFREVGARAHKEVFGHMSLPEFQLMPFVYPEYDDLFRVMFNYMGTHHEKVPELPGVKIQTFPWADYDRRFAEPTHWQDWTGTVFDSADGGLGFRLMGNAALWSEATAHAIAADFLRILQHGAAHPDLPLPPLP